MRSGIYKELFKETNDGSPGYLSLLNLGTSAGTTLDRIIELNQTDESHSYAKRFLKSHNWRYNLLACTILLTENSKSLSGEFIWSAIDKGSWVTPQLIVTASLLNPDFQEQALKRLDINFSMNSTSLFMKLFKFPENQKHLYAKLINSIFAVIEDQKVASLANINSLSEIRKLDLDNSGEIASNWKENIIKLLDERGIKF